MKRYTAQEMRKVAKSLLSSEANLDFDKRDIAYMLRQAADMMERKKKYEYTVKYEDGVISRLHYDCVEPLEHGRNENHRIVRREVYEWEEVEDVHQDGGAR